MHPTSYVKLTEAAASLTIPREFRPEGIYRIDLPTTDHVVLLFAHRLRDAGARFEDPRILAKRLQLLEFKRYSSGGGKYWTSALGTEIAMAVPASSVEIGVSAKYSFVDARINGVDVVFNVCGGSGDGAWTDLVRPVIGLLVGMGVRDMRRIAEVAVPAETLAARGWTFGWQPDSRSEERLAAILEREHSDDPRITALKALPRAPFCITPPAETAQPSLLAL